jgi:hypothetical protein
MRHEAHDQTTPEEVTAAQTDHHREPEPRPGAQQPRDATRARPPAVAEAVL